MSLGHWVLVVLCVLAHDVGGVDYKFDLGQQEPNGDGNNIDDNNAIPIVPKIPVPSVDVKKQFDKAKANSLLGIGNGNGNTNDVSLQIAEHARKHNSNNNGALSDPNINQEWKARKHKGPDMDVLFGKSKEQAIDIAKGMVVGKNKLHGEQPKKAADWAHFSFEGFWPSLSMIIVSEIGDKTFFIAAILAMKHSRFVVWLGAAGALFVMTVLAVVFGSLLQVIPAYLTHYGAGLLFLFFGFKLLWESHNMKGGEASDELREAEEELLEAERKEKQKLREKKQQKRSSSDDIELGRKHAGNGSSRDDDSSSVDIDSYKKKTTTGFNLNILIRSFCMTFVSEIGDRSQITTVVLAAHRNPYGVTIGAASGHAICTALAVIGGKLLASRISEKNVTLIGGILFLVFSLECFVYGPA